MWDNSNQIYGDAKEVASVLQESKTKAKKIVFVDLDGAVAVDAKGASIRLQQNGSCVSIALNDRLVKKLSY